MTQEREIKLPPQPRPATGNPLSAVKVYGWDEVQAYARAAVALNAPQWRKTADDPPPDTDDPVVGMCRGLADTIRARTVRKYPNVFQFWMPLPSLSAGPEAA